MKGVFFSVPLGFALENCLQGQTAAQSGSPIIVGGASSAMNARPGLAASASGTTVAAMPGATIIGRTPTSRTWSWIASQTNAGQATLVTNSYVEVASGLCHSNAVGELVDAVEQIDIVADGASASQAAHHVHFKGNINAGGGGSVHLVAPDGQVFDSQVYGLAYVDTASGSNVLVAPLQDAAGVVVGNNIVLYANAFNGVKADIEYVFKKSGLEQNIILREQPPSPASLAGFNPQTTRLQVLTEFFQPVVPQIKKLTFQGSQEDAVLKFGATSIGPGRAFYAEVPGQGPVAVKPGRVAKHWTQIAGRQFLIEEIPWPAISNAVQNLPLHAAATNRNRAAIRRTASLLPLRPRNVAGTTKSGPMKVAEAMPKQAGLVIDYATVNGSSSGIEFTGGTTYWVSGSLWVDCPGTVTFDGGTIVKIDNSADASIFNSGCSTTVFNTSPRSMPN